MSSQSPYVEIDGKYFKRTGKPSENPIDNDVFKHAMQNASPEEKKNIAIEKYRRDNGLVPVDNIDEIQHLMNGGSWLESRRDRIKSMATGTAKNFVNYLASGAKAFGMDGAKEKLQETRRALERNTPNATWGLVGEMVGDPVNLAPAGIFFKGGKAASRIAKSAGAGAALGVGTSVAKDYGNESVNKNDMAVNAAISGALWGGMNAIFATPQAAKILDKLGGIIKDRFRTIKDNPNATTQTDVDLVNEIMNDPSKFGLSPEDGQILRATFEATKRGDGTWGVGERTQINPNASSDYQPNWGYGSAEYPPVPLGDNIDVLPSPNPSNGDIAWNGERTNQPRYNGAIESGAAGWSEPLGQRAQGAIDANGGRWGMEQVSIGSLGTPVVKVPKKIETPREALDLLTKGVKPMQEIPVQIQDPNSQFNMYHYSDDARDVITTGNPSRTGGAVTLRNGIPKTFLYGRGQPPENQFGIGKNGQYVHEVDISKYNMFDSSNPEHSSLLREAINKKKLEAIENNTYMNDATKDFYRKHLDSFNIDDPRTLKENTMRELGFQGEIDRANGYTYIFEDVTPQRVAKLEETSIAAGTEFDGRTTMASEALPSMSLPAGRAIAKMPIEKQHEYHKVIQKLTTDENGFEQVLKDVGFEQIDAIGVSELSPSYFEGHIGAGQQTGAKVPTVPDANGYDTITDYDIKRLKLAGLIKAFLQDQDAVTFRFITKANSLEDINTLQVELGRPISVDEIKELGAIFNKALGEDSWKIALTTSKDGVDILGVGGLKGQAFQDIMSKADDYLKKIGTKSWVEGKNTLAEKGYIEGVKDDRQFREQFKLLAAEVRQGQGNREFGGAKTDKLKWSSDDSYLETLFAKRDEIRRATDEFIGANAQRVEPEKPNTQPQDVVLGKDAPQNNPKTTSPPDDKLFNSRTDVRNIPPEKIQKELEKALKVGQGLDKANTKYDIAWWLDEYEAMFGNERSLYANSSNTRTKAELDELKAKALDVLGARINNLQDAKTKISPQMNNEKLVRIDSSMLKNDNGDIDISKLQNGQMTYHDGEVWFKMGDEIYSNISNPPRGFDDMPQRARVEALQRNMDMEKTSSGQPTQLYASGAGAFYGIEQDEDGNYTFNPEKALLGVAVGAGIMGLGKKAGGIALDKKPIFKTPEKAIEYAKNFISKNVSHEFQAVLEDLKSSFTNTLSDAYMKARETPVRAINGMSYKLENLHKMLHAFDSETRVQIHKALVGEGDAPKGLEPLVKKIRGDIDKLSRELVDLGILDKNALDEWEGYYIHRSYEKHLRGAFKNLFSQNFEQGSILTRGKVDKLGKKELQKLFDSGEITEDMLSKPLREGGVRVKQLANGKFEVKRDWTPEERAAMGEITDAAYTVPETLLRMHRMVENAKFLRKVSKMTDDDSGVIVLTKERIDELGIDNNVDEVLRKAGYTKLPDNPKYGVLAGQWIRKDAASDISRINDEMYGTFRGSDSPLANLWRAYLKHWKLGKTVGNMPTHLNNIMSNAFLMHLTGMSASEVAVSIGKTIKTIKDGRRLDELVIKQIQGKASIEEIKEIKELEEYTKFYKEGQEIGLFGRSQLNDIMMGDIGVSKKGIYSKIIDKAAEFYNLEDAVSRLAMYKTLREKYSMSKEDALQAVSAIIPDYTKPLPRGWKVLRDFGISPFISWSYYTMPNIIRALNTKQGALQAAKVIGTLAALEYTLTGISPIDNLWFIDGAKPDSYKGRELAIAEKGDNVTTLKINRWIPYFELLEPLNFFKSQFAGVTTNMAVEGGQALLGGGKQTYKLYNGMPITRSNKPTMQQAYDVAKHIGSSYAPIPHQIWNGVELIESLARNKQNRTNNKAYVPRSTAQEIIRFLGLNSKNYSKKGLAAERKSIKDKQKPDIPSFFNKKGE